MPTLTIDNQTVTVPEGTNVLEAAQRLGIVIPHFCYHEALGAVGACRLCAMKFEQGPVKGIQMACLIPAQDGMVVSTVDADARELRAAVIEWLMLNHPHDCPVCDEGGECQLQDMTIAGGHGIRRYRGKKRTWRHQNLGPFIAQEMNRCIQCYRCVRTYQDYCGGTDFGVMGSRNRLFFGRFRDGRLESPFSGNLVDVCPTGVFTDRTFRFRSRAWDLQEAPSVCPHCSLGCAVVPGVRYRELQRVRAGVNRRTNGFFICDRGRFGHGHVNHPERPRTPRQQGAESSWPEALATARRRLQDISEKYGPRSIALLGSSRASLEALARLKDWGEKLGGARFCSEAAPHRDRAARRLTACLGKRTRSLEEIGRGDLIVLAGSDPLNEAPVLALALRQAVSRGAVVQVLDPRPVELSCAFRHIPLAPTELLEVLRNLAEEHPRQDRFGLAAALRQARRPILCGGADLLGEEGVASLAAVAERHDTGLFVTLAGPNSFGGALLAGDGPDADRLCDAMLAGDIRAMVCLETDPLRDGPAQMARAMGKLEFLLVLDNLPNQAARQADIFLPTAALYESAGTLVNNEGRLLPFGSVFAPGEPIAVTGEGNHPPRDFRPDTPGDAPRPAWAVLTQLQQEPLSLNQIRLRLEARDSRFAGLSLLAAGDEGKRVGGRGLPAPAAAAEFPAVTPSGSLPLLVVETLFGSEPLAAHAPALDPVRPQPQVWMHPDTAAALGLAAGDRLRLRTGPEPLVLPLALEPRMAKGLLLAGRLRGTPLEIFPAGVPVPCLVEKGDDDA